MLDTVLRVIGICLPIYGLVLLGFLLRRRGFMDESAQRFLTAFVYRFSLPVLIFLAVAREDFADLLNPSVIMPVVATIGIGGGLALAAAWLIGLPKGLRAPVGFSPFFANTVFLGFPLAEKAFGPAGLTNAAIVNAFGMPLFVATGVLMLLASERREGTHPLRAISGAILNPIVLSALIGLVVSAILHGTGLRDWAEQQQWVMTTWSLTRSVVDPLATIGMPLALMAVGAALRFDTLAAEKGLMAVSVVLKVLVGPAMTLLFSWWWFPDATAAERGTAVLLMAMPLSVGCYVVSSALGSRQDFVAGLLVLSTVAAAVTTPIWVALVAG